MKVLRDKATAIWLLLLAATLAGFEGAQAHGLGFALVMVAATVKAWLIARHYMELREAPLAWRLVFDAMIGGSGVMIGILHFLA